MLPDGISRSGKMKITHLRYFKELCPQLVYCKLGSSGYNDVPLSLSSVRRSSVRLIRNDSG